MRIVFGLNLSLEIISGTYLYLTYGDEKKLLQRQLKKLYKLQKNWKRRQKNGFRTVSRLKAEKKN